jgi:hypothetical protein
MKLEGKSVYVHSMKTYDGREVQLYTFQTSSVLGTRSFYIFAVLSREKAPGAHSVGCWAGFRAGLDPLEMPRHYTDHNIRSVKCI